MIDKLLEIIGEDKHTNPTTTSNKFKTDLYNFCKLEFGKELATTAVELGTHKGQSTYILAEIFDLVHTCNLPGNFDKAMTLNAKHDNIKYVGIDLYNTDIRQPFTTDTIDLFLIDAGHSYDNVMTDFTRATYMNTASPCYFVFDDYGLIPEVKRAINDLIWVGKLEVIKYIGHEPNYDFRNGRVLSDWEGVICKLV